jgi:hypothetical protein
MSEEYAKDYNAANPDHPISKNEAETALLQVALAKVDNQWAAKLGYGDASAQSWLETHYNNLNFKRSDGTDEQVFTATDAEKNDFGMYSDTYMSTFKNAVLEGARCRYGCTPTTFTTGNGLGFYSDYVSSNNGDLTLDGLYLKRQVSTLTPDQADTVAWLGGLKPLLNWSTPPAGTAISVADKQYGQAALQVAGFLLPPAAMESGLIRAGTVASELPKVTESPLGGAGGQWPVLNETVSPSVVQQATSTSCGQACGVMLLGDRGVSVTQGEMSEGLTSAQSLANTLNKFDSGWTGAAVDQGSFGALNRTGSWSAMMWERGSSYGYWVVVDGLDSTGSVMIRDPANGTKYLMNQSDFFKNWNGFSVFKH